MGLMCFHEDHTEGPDQAADDVNTPFVCFLYCIASISAHHQSQHLQQTITNMNNMQMSPDYDGDNTTILSPDVLDQQSELCNDVQILEQLQQCITLSPTTNCRCKQHNGTLLSNRSVKDGTHDASSLWTLSLGCHHPWV